MYISSGGRVEELQIRINIEHRTSNVEHRILMSLRSAIKYHMFSTIRPQILNRLFCLFNFFHSTFDPPEADKCLLAYGELDVRCSMFVLLLFDVQSF